MVGDGGTVITPPGDPAKGTTDDPVNTSATDLPGTMPDVAIDAAGDYVVVWNSNQYGDGGDVVAQRFDRYGNPWARSSASRLTPRASTPRAIRSTPPTASRPRPTWPWTPTATSWSSGRA